MEQKEKGQMEVSTGMKVCRVIGTMLLLAAIVYIVWPGDFDSKFPGGGFNIKAVVGYVDDCFVFMAAYMFLRGSFLKPERRYIRRQFYMLSSLFALLALCWVILLAFMK